MRNINPTEPGHLTLGGGEKKEKKKKEKKEGSLFFFLRAPFSASHFVSK